LIEFTGLNELSKANGIAYFDMKLFRLCRGKPENYHIATNHQWSMELPLLIMVVQNPTNETNKLEILEAPSCGID